MKKLFLILSILFFAGTLVKAQHRYKWDRYSVSFESSVKLDLYETESIDVFGSDHDDYAVDISGFDDDYYTKYSKRSSWKNTAFDMAGNFGFTNIRDGGSLPLIDSGYYVIGESTEGTFDATVILIVALDTKKRHYIEGTIYCYNHNESVGVQIAKTFKFF